MTKGFVHSIQSLGTVDGPGVRFVVFLQGCNLRCKCCHNPDTWEMNKGTVLTAEEIVNKALRYKSYFGKEGGITLSGGEPLLQAEFAAEIFSLCREKGINTCLDTSGSIMSASVKKLLSVTDRVLLDIKYTSDSDYRENAGCDMKRVLDFLAFLEEKKIPVTLRQVIIPEINDTADNIIRLKELAGSFTVVDKTELLRFRKICQTKYDSMGIVFPFGQLEECSAGKIEELKALL